MGRLSPGIGGAALLLGVLLLGALEPGAWLLAERLGRPFLAGGSWARLAAAAALLVGVVLATRRGLGAGLLAGLGVGALFPVHPADLPGSLMVLAGGLGGVLIAWGGGRVLPPRTLAALASGGGALLRLPAGVYALLGGGAAAAASLGFARGLPLVTDGYCYRYLAALLLHGRLTGPVPVPPALAPLVQIPFTGGEGSWFIQHPPGFAVLVAAGLALGAPALVNPVLHAVLVAAIHGVARALGEGKETAGGAALAAALAPLLVFYAGLHLAHTATAGLLYAGVWALLRAPRRGYGRVALAGALFGAALATRPYTALLFGLPWALGAIRRWGLRGVGAAFLGAALPVGLFLAYNAAVTGSPWRLGYEALHGPAHRPGFGLRGAAGAVAPFTPAMGLLHLQHRLHFLQHTLLLWPAPLLLLAAWGWRRGSGGGRGRLLASFLAVAAGYAAYFSRFDLLLDPRFLLEGMPAVLVFLVRGWARLPGRPGVRVLLALSWTAAALGVRLPAVAGRMEVHFRAARELVRRAQALAGERAVLFVGNDLYEAYPGLALDPWLRGAVVVARQGGRADRALARALEREPAYLARCGGWAWVYREGGPPRRLAGAQAAAMTYLGHRNRVFRLAPGEARRLRLGAAPGTALVFGWFGGGEGELRVRVDGREALRVRVEAERWMPREGFFPLLGGETTVTFSARGAAVAVLEPAVVAVEAVRRLGPWPPWGVRP